VGNFAPAQNADQRDYPLCERNPVLEALLLEKRAQWEKSNAK
jgi:hypothetical protein